VGDHIVDEEGPWVPASPPPARNANWLRYVAAGILLVAIYVTVSIVPLPLSNPPGNEETLEDLPPLALHSHVNLTITVRGESRLVPARIGIAVDLWNDHSLDSYGIPGIAPLHTHTASGRIHIESSIVRDYMLREFFAIWGEPLGPDRLLDATAGPGEGIIMVVDGTERTLDPGLGLQDEMIVRIILR